MDQLLRALKVIMGSQGDLKITSAEMTNIAHIARETVLQSNRVWVDFKIQPDNGQSGFHFDASKIFDAPKREIEAQCFLRDIITQPKKVGFTG